MSDNESEIVARWRDNPKLYFRQHYLQNKQARDQQVKTYKKQRRTDLINEFGGKCVKCGESDHIVLEFDHINDDGYLDKSRATIIFRVAKEPHRFQLLCCNCNRRKELLKRQKKDTCV